MVEVGCWSCTSSVGWGEVCPTCGALQPISEGTDHFSVFGLPQKANLDLGALEASFHVLSRRFHPDFYQTQSSRAQAVSLENSARLNVAYRTLRDPIARVEYLLELAGLAAGTPSDPPAELFEEILELQEARQEHRATKNPAVRSRLQGALSDLRDRKAVVEEELYGLFGEWDRLLAGPGEQVEKRRKLLERMREILATRAYLGTAISDIDEDLKGS